MFEPKEFECCVNSLSIFGEMTFLDHCKITEPGGSKIVILVLLDGATTLLTAQPVGSTEESESIRHFQDYLENYELTQGVFFDLQARATSEIAVADLSDSENR